MKTDTIAGVLLVLTLIEIVVIEAGRGTEHYSNQLFGINRPASINSA